jgi:ribulose-phosphate 3-epimerase
MSDFILSTSILSANFAHLQKDIQECEEAGTNWIHVDVMDGHFVPNISMGAFVVEHVRRMTRLPIDVHLMIEKPEHHIDSFSKAGADWISIHGENNPNLHRTLQRIRELGCHPGVAINPGTPVNVIEPIIPFIDYLLILTVNPGYSGQKFLPGSAERIIKACHLITECGSSINVQVDGGITPDTLQIVYQAGARIVVAATSIFKHSQGIAAGIRDLRNAVVRN